MCLHTSTGTFIYWSFRCLWACRCLKNRLLAWLDCLYPVSRCFRGSHGQQQGWHRISSFFYHPCAASLNLLLPILSLEDHLWSLSTQRNMNRQTKQKKRGLWLLHGLWPTSQAFKHGMNPLQQLQGRAEKSCFPWRRDWKITRLRIRGDWKLQEDYHCKMTKLPWYACELTSHLTVITYRTESQLQEEPQVCPLWSIWTSQTAAHLTEEVLRK